MRQHIKRAIEYTAIILTLLILGQNCGTKKINNNSNGPSANSNNSSGGISLNQSAVATPSPTPPGQTFPPQISRLPPAGVFWRTNPNSDVPRYGGRQFIKGGRATFFTWCQVEPTRGNYDFSEIDATINQWKVHGKRVVIGISGITNSVSKMCKVRPNQSTSPLSAAPGWLFENLGAPYVEAQLKKDPEDDDPGNYVGTSYWAVPWSQVFISKFERMFEQLLIHLRAQNLLNDVAWFEFMNGRENSTTIGIPEVYAENVQKYLVSNVARDLNQDNNIDETDFLLFWSDQLKQSIRRLGIRMRLYNTNTMLTIGDFQVPVPLGTSYYPYLKSVAIEAQNNGLILGGKTLDTNVTKMNRKAYTMFLGEHLPGIYGLWNDFTAFGRNQTVDDFIKNYANAIGGGSTGVTQTNISYTYLAPSNEVEAIIAKRKANSSCAEDPDDPAKCWARMPTCTGDPTVTNLCWPELKQTVINVQNRLVIVR